MGRLLGIQILELGVAQYTNLPIICILSCSRQVAKGTLEIDILI